jgi:hypothetical protein
MQLTAETCTTDWNSSRNESAVKKLNMLNYEVHVMHKMGPPDSDKRTHYCEWLLQK